MREGLFDPPLLHETVGVPQEESQTERLQWSSFSLAGTK